MRKKRTPINQSKIGQINSGINSTTKAQLKKIQSANLDTTLPPVQYSDVYMYVKKSWTYKGKSCMLCSKVMNDPIVLENHHYVCIVNKQRNHKGFYD
jgi:hypothetical protein